MTDRKAAKLPDEISQIAETSQIANNVREPMALVRAKTAPRYVSKRTAMALLDLSLSGFRNWVKQGILPPPCPGTPLHEPRWCWSEIEQWLGGDRSSCRRDLFEVDAPIGRMRGPRPGQGGRSSKLAGARDELVDCGRGLGRRT